MNVISVEIAILIILILANGFLAMSEIAVISARKVRLQQMQDNGKPGARAALELAETPGHFLSTVQIGITLVGILTGVFGGATVAEEFAKLLDQAPFLVPYSQTISVTLVVLVITYFFLVLGELAPKQIALHNAEGIAAGVAPFMKRFSRLAAPLVHFLSFSTAGVLRLLGIRPSSEPEITEEDIKVLLEQGAEDGILAPIEEEMVQQVFRLGDLQANELMTPRPDVIYLDLEDSLQENCAKIAASGFSRFPLVQGNMDVVVGILRAKDLLIQYMNGQPPDFKSAMRPPLFVPEGTPAIQVLEHFRQKRLHMAFVIDEYGGIQGIITPTDILEAIVGDMPDLNDTYDPEIVQREDGSWLLDGMLSADEMRELLQVKELPGEGENTYQTLGGLVMAYLSRVPTTGDVFEWNQLRFEVVDMDGHRVDKVLVKPLSPPPENL